MWRVYRDAGWRVSVVSKANCVDVSLQRSLASSRRLCVWARPLTCVATVATSLKTEFSTSASLGSGTVSLELWDVSGRIRLHASSKASAGSVPLFLLTRRIVVFGSMLSLGLSEFVWFVWHTQRRNTGALTPPLFPGTAHVTAWRSPVGGAGSRPNGNSITLELNYTWKYCLKYPTSL